MRFCSLILAVPLAVNMPSAGSAFAAAPGTHAAAVPGTDQSGTAAERVSLRVMTFNIKWQGNDSGKFVESGFARRKSLILDVLKQSAADVIGLQEASLEQRSALAPELEGFGMFPPPAEAGDSCILYSLGRFDLQAAGHDDLRRKPEQPDTNIGVRGFFWVYLHDRVTGRRFYVANIHADHRSSVRGRQLDGILIGNWIRKREHPDAVILTGDFNGTPDRPRYQYLTGRTSYPGEDGVNVKMPVPMVDTFAEANPNARYTGTLNPGYSGIRNRKQVDYVFVPRGSRVISSKIIYYNVEGAYPSDHYPLLSEFELE